MANILVSSASDYFTDHVPVSEGLISYEIVKRLAERGHNLWVISPKVRLKDRLPKNVRLFETGSHDIFSNNVFEIESGRLRFALQSFFISRKIMEREKIDVVHHILPSDFGKFFDFVPLLKRPFVVGPAFLPWELPKRELLVSEGWSTKLAGHFGLPYKEAKRQLFLKTIERCDVLLLSTRKLGRVYSGLVDTSRMHLVPVGVDTSVFRPAPAKGATIFASGFLNMRKGFEYLIRAMPKIIGEVPEAKLVIAGDGIHRKYFEGIVAELGLQTKVAFLGRLSRQQMVKHYQNCSIFCLPSLFEPFGMVVLEAMACGKPIVATNAGGTPEVVRNGKNGLLVPPRNPEAIAGAIITLLSDRRKLERFGKNSRRLSLSYDWETVVGKIERIYARLF